MNAKHSDLIAIANAGLAKKLDTASKKEKQTAEKASQDANEVAVQEQRAFKQDVWRAVFTLNLMRYGLALALISITGLVNYRPDWVPIENLLYPGMFMFSTVFILISAIVFSYVTARRLVPFNTLVLVQFALDLILVTCLVHSVGSIQSTFTLLYIMVVATGSIVLPRIQALGLAAGAIILMFYEHLYSVLKATAVVEADYGLLIGYGLLMFLIAWTISYLAQRLRIAELKSFVPGNESIEEFLVREEIKALKTALAKTEGNKTEAAKLIGMTFRSFRYKLTKYDIA